VQGDRAFSRNDASLAFTTPGYAIHHTACVFWAALYRLLRRHRHERHAGHPLIDAGVTAALAYGVDYALTPARFTPGYERRLGPLALMLSYGGLALGLAASEWVTGRRSTRTTRAARPGLR
jgi:hypothetical protein